LNNVRKPTTLRAHIVVHDEHSLINEMKKLGIHDKEVFFKYRRGKEIFARQIKKNRHRRTRFTPDLIETEYDMLRALYRAAPENVAAPICLVRDRDGEVIGYLVEYINGDRLSSLMLESSSRCLPMDERVEMMKEVVGIMNRLHEAGVGHGDLYYRNMLRDRKDRRVKLVDPITHPDGLGAAIKEAIRSDMERLDGTIAYIEVFRTW